MKVGFGWCMALLTAGCVFTGTVLAQAPKPAAAAAADGKTTAGAPAAKTAPAGNAAAPAAAKPKDVRTGFDQPLKKAEGGGVPDVGASEMGSKEEIEELLRGEGGKGGDQKKFVVATKDDISLLEVGDIYKNEDTAYKIIEIKDKGAKGGHFVAQRISGMSDPQRRWMRISGSGPASIVTSITLLDLYKQGGIFLHPIAALFVVLVILSINGLFIYRRKVHCAPEFVSAAEGALRKGDLKAFEDLANANKGLMPFICRAMMDNFETSSMEETRLRVEAATVTQIGRLRVPIRAMNLIAVAAPLLGLLGTIIGMVLVFEGVAGASGAAKASILAAGIRVKLFSTATALMVAIPALFIYFGFSQKLNNIIGECEMINERFLHLLGRQKRAQGASEGGSSSAMRRRGAPEEGGEC
jgi:biopolymer transport protein ExbB